MPCGMPEEAQKARAAGLPFRSRVGTPTDDDVGPSLRIVASDRFKGEVIRLDRAIRLAPK
jgi:hypothetical protein